MKLKEQKIDFINVLLEWVLEDEEERRPILDSIYELAVKKVKDREFAKLLKSLKTYERTKI